MCASCGITAATTYSWRLRVSACFQDFARIELSVRDSVGVGNVHADGPVAAAVGAAGADAVVDRAGGLDGVLGLRYAAGAELSVGQWQLVALHHG